MFFSSIKFRPATQNDIAQLITLYGQQHASPFMSIGDLNPEALKETISIWINTRLLFVLADDQRILATRRLVTNKGEYAHTIELCSFVVAEQYARKGYGQEITNYLIEKIKKDMPDIKRVEIGIDTDNEAAQSFAKKQDFQSEVLSPGWYKRLTGPAEYQTKWRVGAHILTKYLDPTFKDKVVDLVKTFDPCLPVPSEASLDFNITPLNESCYQIYFEQKLQAKISITQGSHRASHINFWQVSIEPNGLPEVIKQGLMQLLCQEALTACKKIEINSTDRQVITILQSLGFHYRGTKRGAVHKDGQYYNEIVADFGFFNIQDAKEVLKIYVNEDEARIINEALDNCNNAINKVEDEFTKIYLNNMALQICCERLGEKAMQIYNLQNQNAPWGNLISNLPVSLQESFVELDNATLISKPGLDCSF